MKFLWTVKVLTACLLLSLPPAVKPQEAEYGKWDNGIGHSSWDVALDKEERAKLAQLWESIGEDLKTEQNGLAGTYFKGGYSAGYFFRWSVNKGYVLVPYFDQSLIADFSFGKVTVVDSSDVDFTPEKDLRGDGSIRKMPRRWTAVGRHFVPVEMLGDFGDYMAGLGRYNEFNGRCCEFAPNFLAQKIDAREGEPARAVAAKYARFIKRPVEAEVTFVGSKKTVKDWGYQGELYGEWMERAVLIPIRISAGSAHGLRRNMLLRLVGEPDYYQYVQVMRVGRRAASGYVVRDISADGIENYRDPKTDRDEPLPPIRVGMRVTTGLARD